MPQRSNEIKRGKTINVEMVFLGILVPITVGLSLLDFFGFLDNVSWLAERIPTMTLLAIGVIAGYLVLERRSLEGMRSGSNQHYGELSEALSHSTATIIESLEGVELRRFESGNEMLLYVAEKLSRASSRVDDLSWSPAVGLDSSLEATKEIEAKYAERVTNVSNSIPYREVFCFNRPGRVEKLTRRLRENAPGYSCSYYLEAPVPLLQFMIIDNEEVIFLSDQFESRLAIRHPRVARLFSEYYELIWNSAKPIKIGVNIREEVVEEILGKTTKNI